MFKYVPGQIKCKVIKRLLYFFNFWPIYYWWPNGSISPTHERAAFSQKIWRKYPKNLFHQTFSYVFLPSCCSPFASCRAPKKVSNYFFSKLFTFVVSKPLTFNLDSKSMQLFTIKWCDLINLNANSKNNHVQNRYSV